MNEILQHRLLAGALLALATALGGELAGSTTLVALGVTGFFLTLVTLLFVMTGALVAGLRTGSESAMNDPAASLDG